MKKKIVDDGDSLFDLLAEPVPQPLAQSERQQIIECIARDMATLKESYIVPCKEFYETRIDMYRRML